MLTESGLRKSYNRKFGVTPDQLDGMDPQIKQMILVAATSIGSEMIGKYITKEIIIQVLKKIGVRIATKQVAKYIPILGQALSAGISFGAMKLVGNSHVDECYTVVKRAVDAQVRAKMSQQY